MSSKAKLTDMQHSVINMCKSSKLYSVSKHKSTILAAIQDPINSELVSQLVKDVDLDSLQSADVEPHDEIHPIQPQLPGEDFSDDMQDGDNNLDEEDMQQFEDSGSFDIDSIPQILEDEIPSIKVNRINQKDNEIWIYYDDTINMNDIMNDVISVISSTSSDIEFNRLARTDNAMVFVQSSTL